MRLPMSAIHWETTSSLSASLSGSNRATLGRMLILTWVLVFFTFVLIILTVVLAVPEVQRLLAEPNEPDGLNASFPLPPSHRSQDRRIIIERMYAVAVRDGKDLFLWIRLRRTGSTDIYYVFPTGRDEQSEWKKWNPHGSWHKDGRTHHKSYDRKSFARQRQKPDSNFTGSENLITRPIARNEPRAFGVPCHPAEFSQVMEIPAGVLSDKRYETQISIDLTERGGNPILVPGCRVLAQHVFNDSVPEILVTLFNHPIPR